MDLKLIEAFLKIAQEGSFTRAAKRLFISQSAISLRISQLEEELNTQLFERNRGQEIKLTPQGEKIYPILKNAVDLISLVPSVLQNSIDINNISIVFPVHLADYIIPPLCEVLYKSFPNYNFSFNIGESRTIIGDVKEGNYDVGFIYHDSELSGTHLNVHEITNEPTLLVTSPYHPKNDMILSLEDLQDEKIIIYHRAFLPYVLLKNFFIEYGFKNFNMVEIQNFKSIKRMMLEENYVAFLQRFIVRDDLNNRSLTHLKINPEPPATRIYLLARKNIPQNIIHTILDVTKNFFVER